MIKAETMRNKGYVKLTINGDDKDIESEFIALLMEAVSSQGYTRDDLEEMLNLAITSRRVS